MLWSLEEKLISIDIKQQYDQIFEVIKEESHSRLPVYEKNQIIYWIFSYKRFYYC